MEAFANYITNVWLSEAFHCTLGFIDMLGPFVSLKGYTESEYSHTLSFVYKAFSDIYILSKYPTIRYSSSYLLRIEKLSASCRRFHGLMSSLIL